MNFVTSDCQAVFSTIWLSVWLAGWLAGCLLFKLITKPRLGLCNCNYDYFLPHSHTPIHRWKFHFLFACNNQPHDRRCTSHPSNAVVFSSFFFLGRWCIFFIVYRFYQLLPEVKITLLHCSQLFTETLHNREIKAPSKSARAWPSSIFYFQKKRRRIKNIWYVLEINYCLLRFVHWLAGW